MTERGKNAKPVGEGAATRENRLMQNKSGRSDGRTEKLCKQQKVQCGEETKGGRPHAEVHCCRKQTVLVGITGKLRIRNDASGGNISSLWPQSSFKRVYENCYIKLRSKRWESDCHYTFTLFFVKITKLDERRLS